MKFLWLFSILFFSSPLVFGGSLDEFEENATTPKPQKKSSNDASRHHEHKSSNDCGSLSGCIADDVVEGTVNGLIEIAALMIVEGGKHSLNRLSPPPASDITPRMTGDPLIPYARFDTHYLNANNGIRAVDLKLELGYGPAAVEIRRTRFSESYPADELKLAYIHALYRMSLGDKVGFNMGFGRATLEGDNINSGSSFTFPLLIHWSKNLGIETRYTASVINGNSLIDKDIALVLTHSATALTLGYRSVSTPGSTIRGPFAGLSVRW